MTGKQEQRKERILDLLSKEKRADVAALAELLEVSQVTIRKDLDALEAQGFIQRIHGFAELNTTDDISARLAYHYDSKKKIAERAAEFVHDGDTVMIESGSCCALLAGELARNRTGLTIITNSAFIAESIRSYKNVQIILLGGIYQPDSQCLVGPMIRDNAENYHVRYFFIGTDGWSERTGFTNKDAMRAQAVRDMAHSCDEMVILTESEKFQTPGTIPLNVKNQPKMLITDSGLSDEKKSILEKLKIQIVS